MEFLANPQVWLDLLILTLLEVILGIDNIVFVVLASNRLPASQQMFARRLGLALAMLMRLALLAVIFWLAHLTTVLFHIGPIGFSIRDLVEFIGGLFLLVKACLELYEYFKEHRRGQKRSPGAKFWMVITQIMLLDVIFSLDSVITAVAIAKYYTVMATAIIIAIIVMMVASEPVNYFINRFTRVKLLALLLILLVGIMLVVRGVNINFPEWYLYIAIGGLAAIILPPWKKWLVK